MQLNELFYGVGFIPLGVKAGLDISDAAVNSGAVKAGGAFICLRGTKADGHAFIPEAVSRGAALIVAEEGALSSDERNFLTRSGEISLVTVKNTRRACAFIFDNLNGRPSSRLKFFAVTGTNGKTTVASLLDSIMRESGLSCALIGTTTGASIANMTTPDPEILYPRLNALAKSGVEFVAMEASSHALAYDKLAPIIFETGIFTNLTPEHLDFHPTMDDYYAAKAKLFEQCRVGCFNYDDPSGRRMYENSPCDRFYYSISDASPEIRFAAKNITSLGISGSEYDLFSEDIALSLRTPMPGLYNVSNTLCAAAVMLDYGIERRAIRDGIRKMKGAVGRMERVPCRRDDITVFIDYAHTPDALENLLRSVRLMLTEGQRLTLLFGCGGDRDRAKRPVMGAIASRLCDLVIVTSDNSRSEKPSDIIAQIVRGMDRSHPYTVIEDRREAILFALREARPNEVVILAGKGHENYEINDTGIHPFDEREICAMA